MGTVGSLNCEMSIKLNMCVLVYVCSVYAFGRSTLLFYAQQLVEGIMSPQFN